MNEADAAVRESPEGIAATAATAAWSAARAALDDSQRAARQAIIKAYQETGNKKPAVGANVRVMRRVRYDFAEALEWSRTHAPELLTLSLKDYEYRALHDAIKGAPYIIEEEPQATLAADLSAYLVEGAMTA